ncbi:aldehyde dehydrogenase [Agrobacterium rubi]|uniref:aldehyde dehydrogenase n=1 Tax=Agrobacterium rubi TaxID=28099 RepID=UPI0015731A58|nr:aldehyde dehydrogenase [Agrobacterium rubi]NTF10549.1 aldehyde dehydrogenase [Agrobacterium rubi]NTF22943.1 aldehyde dehydrogenase [Agrobacterium rubi]NTF29874.1 aldehyde dehydrogenase [Agrobacterium rubi]
MEKYQLFINGQWQDPADGRWLDTVNPYTGEVWAQIPRGSGRDVDLAVEAADHALKNGPWATMTPSARGKLMRKLGDLVAENAEKLAEIEVRDNGKLYAEMIGQTRYHPEWWYYFGGLADKIEGSVVPIDKPDLLTYTTSEPIGVVAALTAWNSPLMFVAWKCAPAIAAGCTIVIKPSEYTSASTLAFAALTKQAGFPDGVFNVVTGLGAEVGAPLVEHPGVSKVTFTGSDTTGAAVYQAAAKSLKRVSLELGGKSPNIVFADANFDAALSGVISGIFAATGQTCIAGSRLLVQNSIKDEFVQKLVDVGKNAKLGDPMLPDVNIGPVTTQMQYRKILDYIDIAKAEGARCVLGGAIAEGPGLTGGQFVQPTIFADVTNDMRIAQEEVFGPVLSVIGFEDEDEAVRIGNDVIYGLAAGVWTRDIGRAIRMTKRLKAGMVWVNTYRATSYMMPFGGAKKSGIGRESGVKSIQEFLETKSIWISTSDAAPANPFVGR